MLQNCHKSESLEDAKPVKIVGLLESKISLLPYPNVSKMLCTRSKDSAIPRPQGQGVNLILRPSFLMQPSHNVGCMKIMFGAAPPATGAIIVGATVNACWAGAMTAWAM